MKRLGLLYTFLITLPIIDLLSSISNRFYDIGISFGLIIKGIAMLIAIYYVFFKSTSKYKKITLVYFGFILLFILGYFLFKPDLLSTTYFFNEFKYLIKLVYFPVMFFTFFNIFDEKGFDKKELNKIMLVSMLLYILLIIVPTIFNINFDSYLNDSYKGTVGWFYSANEVSTILLLLFPFIFILVKKNYSLLLILFFLSLYTISLIGTKVTLFGIIIIMFLLVLAIILKKRKIINKDVGLIVLMFIITIFFMVNNYSVFNLKSSLNQEDSSMINDILENNDFYENDNNPSKFMLELRSLTNKLLSNRDIFAINTYYIYRDNYQSHYLLFGIGHSNTLRVDNYRIEKLIEIDILDVFFHMGLIALFILLFPFIYVFYIFFKNKKYYKFNPEILFFSITILLTLGISSTAGHVFSAPAVSIYIAIYFAYLANELNCFKKKEINNNKVTILSLHMGYGGIENAIANISSMLVDRYEVEILSLYNKKEDIPFEIDKNVKIIYLSNICSNKQEIKTAMKNKKIITLIKEIVKAIYILSHKTCWMKKAICESDAKVIISNRYEFSKILNKYGRNDIIKIHQEHAYKVDDKYINKLNKFKNIDYVMPVSVPLKEAYDKKINNNIKYIPLALNYYPKDEEVSKINTKNLIAIGRLEIEKGFVDLIEVMKLVVQKDPDVYLNLFGEGSLRVKIEELIKEYKLDKNIKVWGFKKQEFIKKYLKESSLYVMTSLEESFGLVLMEAMSYGVPCIMFDSAKGGLSIVNKRNGFIIKNRSNEDMAKQIIKFLDTNVNVREKYSKECRLLSKRYRKNAIKKEWLDFIDKVIEE